MGEYDMVGKKAVALERLRGLGGLKSFGEMIFLVRNG